MYSSLLLLHIGRLRAAAAAPAQPRPRPRAARDPRRSLSRRRRPRPLPVCVASGLPVCVLVRRGGGCGGGWPRVQEGRGGGDIPCLKGGPCLVRRSPSGAGAEEEAARVCHPPPPPRCPEPHSWPCPGRQTGVPGPETAHHPWRAPRRDVQRETAPRPRRSRRGGPGAAYPWTRLGTLRT